MIVEDMCAFIDTVTARKFNSPAESRAIFEQVEFSVWHRAPSLSVSDRRKLLGRLNRMAATLFTSRQLQRVVFTGHVYRETCRILLRDTLPRTDRVQRSSVDAGSYDPKSIAPARSPKTPEKIDSSYFRY